MKAIFLTKDGLESKMEEIPGSSENPSPRFLRPLRPTFREFGEQDNELMFEHSVQMDYRIYEFIRKEIILNSIEVVYYLEQ